MKSLTFNGEKKKWLYLLEGREKAVFPSVERNLLHVSGVHGAYLLNSEVQPLLIRQPIGMVIKNDSEMLSIKDELAEWLFTSERVELVFDDEPGRTYYAVAQNTIEDMERFASFRTGTIEFLCADPYAYGEEQTVSFESGHALIANAGTAEAYPIFDLTVTQNSSLIYIGNLDNIDDRGDRQAFYAGVDKQIDETPVEPQTLVMHDTMQSTANWTGASEVDSGHVTGQFGVDNEGFFVEEWGDEDNEDYTNVWIGPSLQRQFDNPLDSFQADIYIANRNIGAVDEGVAVGIIEVYMRDANQNLVCKMQFGDTSDVLAKNKGVFVTSGNRFNAEHTRESGWNNFNGLIRIVRKSTGFYPYIAQIIDGQHTGRFVYGPIAVNSQTASTNPVTTIQVAMRKWVGARRMYQRIKEIKVHEIREQSSYPSNSVAQNFRAGDHVQIDTQRGLVLLNGEPRNDLIHLDSSFITLIEGINTIESSSNITGSVSFRNRYL